MVKGTVSSTHEEQRDGRVDTYLGDSWFALVDAAVELKKCFNSNFIGAIKTNHSKSQEMAQRNNEGLATWISPSA